MLLIGIFTWSIDGAIGLLSYRVVSVIKRDEMLLAPSIVTIYPQRFYDHCLACIARLLADQCRTVCKAVALAGWLARCR